MQKVMRLTKSVQNNRNVNDPTYTSVIIMLYNTVSWHAWETARDQLLFVLLFCLGFAMQPVHKNRVFWVAPKASSFINKVLKKTQCQMHLLQLSYRTINDTDGSCKYMKNRLALLKKTVWVHCSVIISEKKAPVADNQKHVFTLKNV